MLGRVRAWLASLVGQQAETEQHEDSRFRPSELDRSVRYAHGGGNEEATRELKKLQDQAADLEEHDK